MSVIDNYGDFELPEEKSVIEVVEDPVKVVLSTYELFKSVSERKIAKEIIKEYGANWAYDVQFRDDLYKDAENLFDGKEKIKLSDEQIKQVIGVVEKEAIPWNTSGIFLSALQNKTQLDLLIVDNMKTGIIGYKLKPNKMAVAGKRTSAFFFGNQSQGNTINLGNMRYQGVDATNGIHINAGELTFNGFAICDYDNKGIYVNVGNCYFEYDEDDGYGYNLNVCLVQNELKLLLTTQDFPLKKGPSNYEKKLNELDFLKTTKDVDELSKKIRSFDFQKFEEQLRKIVRDEMVR